MDFTRQPIIETVISPKDGYKLLIRNSKEASQEEYLVNALEIVSFGNALFFRCLERKPKAFLLPIADYDVVEVKETRMVLKNVSTDKPIKIAESKPSSKENNADSSKEEAKSDGESKKSSKKRHSRKRRSAKSAEKAQDKETADTPAEESKESKEAAKKPSKSENKQKNEDVPASSSIVSVIFPPPPKIIGRKLPEESAEQNAKNIFPEAIEQPEIKEEVKAEPKEELREEPKEESTEVASSKNLPKLEEIKEVSEEKEEPAHVSKTDSE